MNVFKKIADFRRQKISEDRRFQKTEDFRNPISNNSFQKKENTETTSTGRYFRRQKNSETPPPSKLS